MATKKQLEALAKGRAKRKKNINAKSQITKKPPTKRLKQRRAENTKKGYFPNPKKLQYMVQVKVRGNRIGYLTKLGKLDDEIEKGARLSLKSAESRATAFFNAFKKLILWVKVIPAPK